MKVISWNMGIAYGPYKQWHERAWHWLAAVDPDIALLQECAPPNWARERWNVHNLDYNRWASAVVVRRDRSARPVELKPDSLLARFESYLATVELDVGPDPLLVASVHVSTREADEASTLGFDRAAMARASVGQPWFNDVAFAGYRELAAGRRFLIGGDWNTARYLDAEGAPKTDGSEFFGRAESAGWVDVSLPDDGMEGRTWYGSTNPRPYQPDHVFADPETATLIRAVSIDPYPTADLGLSDHAPLVLNMEPAMVGAA